MKTFRTVLVTLLLLAAGCRVGVAQNILHFASADAAVRYVRDENNVANYKGMVFGSEEFPVALPSGKRVSNWLVNCAFSDAFAAFGKECIPLLIDLLGSDTEYLRVGAFHVLQKKAGRYDQRSHSEAIDQRRAALAEWKAWWERNQNNPRLDAPVTRTYSAENWELQRRDR